jgi:hypothetical protein
LEASKASLLLELLIRVEQLKFETKFAKKSLKNTQNRQKDSKNTAKSVILTPKTILFEMVLNLTVYMQKNNDYEF